MKKNKSKLCKLSLTESILAKLHNHRNACWKLITHCFFYVLIYFKQKFSALFSSAWWAQFQPWKCQHKILLKGEILIAQKYKAWPSDFIVSQISYLNLDEQRYVWGTFTIIKIHARGDNMSSFVELICWDLWKRWKL